jgi:hypothetical protein
MMCFWSAAQEMVFGLLGNGVWFASMGLVSMAFGLLGCLVLIGVWFCMGRRSLWKKEYR